MLPRARVGSFISALFCPQYEFKAKGIKKKKVTLEVSVDGLKVTLRKKKVIAPVLVLVIRLVARYCVSIIIALLVLFFIFSFLLLIFFRILLYVCTRRCHLSFISSNLSTLECSGFQSFRVL